MKSPRLLLVLMLLLSTAAWLRPSAEEAENIRCRQALWLADPETSDQRKYAPDREIDILNLALDITPDFQERTIAAIATLTFKPIAKALFEIQLDAVDLNVKSVTSTAKVKTFQVTGKKLIVRRR
jgi:aminopeptidase N